MILAIVLVSLDLLTTWYITSNGGVELNPLGQNITLFLIIKVIVLIGLSICIILYKKWKIKYKAINIFFIFFDLWYGIAFINNLINIIKFWFSH